MATIIFSSPDMLGFIAKQVKLKRLTLNFSQQGLSERSGVSLGVLKKFEHTGKISLESLLKLAVALGCLEDFAALFKAPTPENLLTLDELLNEKKRQRGRE